MIMSDNSSRYGHSGVRDGGALNVRSVCGGQPGPDNVHHQQRPDVSIRYLSS